MELVRVNEMLPEVEAIECSIADGAVSEGLEGEVREALKDFKLKSDQWRPLEDLQTLTLRISNHIDQRNSEQKAVYNCLRTIERNTRETINTVRVLALLIAVVAGFWSAIAWWIWRDEIRSVFYVAANLISSSFSELLTSMH
jgi:hypothetical protein